MCCAANIGDVLYGLSLLTSLQSADLSHQAFHGTLPNITLGMSNLEVLNLAHNDLSVRSPLYIFPPQSCSFQEAIVLVRCATLQRLRQTFVLCARISTWCVRPILIAHPRAVG